MQLSDQSISYIIIGVIFVSFSVICYKLYGAIDEFLPKRKIRIYSVYSKTVEGTTSTGGTLETGALANFTQLPKLLDDRIELIDFEYIHDHPLYSVLNKVSTGKVLDAAIVPLSTWLDIDPMFNLLSNTPFIYSGMYCYTAMKRPEGQRIVDAFGKKHNIKIIPCFGTMIQLGGWFKNVPKSIDDLKNVKIATSGITAQIYKRLGAQIMEILPENLYETFKSDKCNAVEFSSAVDDYYMKFYEISKNCMVPGWQKLSEFKHLIINLDYWNRLSGKEQQNILMGCDYTLLKLFSLRLSDVPHAYKLLNDKGVNFISWSNELMMAFYEKWTQIINEYAAKDPLINKLILYLHNNHTNIIKYNATMKRSLDNFIQTKHTVKVPSKSEF